MSLPAIKIKEKMAKVRAVRGRGKPRPAKTPRTAIRWHCIECLSQRGNRRAGNVLRDEIRTCTDGPRKGDPGCPLYPFRPFQEWSPT